MGISVRQKILEKYDIDRLNASILEDHRISGGDDVEVLDELLRTYLRGGTAVEIGTKRGVGAAVLAHYADRVITFDPAPESKRAQELWDYLDVADRIEQRGVSGNVADVSGIDFQFALIDGDHSAEHVRMDFDAVKHCGMVLFHDYGDDRRYGVKQVVDGMLEPGEKLLRPPYALWVKI